MIKYQIGDLVLIKDKDDTSRVYELDGVASKLINGKLTTFYESGITRFEESEILAKVNLQKPRKPRTRKIKENIEPELPIMTNS